MSPLPFNVYTAHIKSDMKVKPSLFMLRRHILKFLNSTLDGGEWPDSRLAHFTQGKSLTKQKAEHAGWDR